MNPSNYIIENVFDMYRNKARGLPDIESPSAYGLQGFAEINLRHGQGGGERLHLWQRMVGHDKPTYVVYHGVNGHWGHLMQVKGDRPRASDFRIEWLKSFPADANIVAVSMPGFGNSTGTPSRLTFDAANAALYTYLTSTLDLPASQMIVAGESMGANHALNFAAHAHEQGKPVAQVTAVAPFRDIAAAAADVVELGGWVSLEGRRKLAADIFGSSHHFHDNVKEIDRLAGSPTQLVIVSSGQDDICRPWHQRVLFARAFAHGMPVVLHLQDDAHHTDWDQRAVMNASHHMLQADSEAEGMRKAWAEGINARPPVPVPSLPENGQDASKSGQSTSR